MIEIIIECMERITSGKVKPSLITVNTTLKNNNIFIIDDNLCNNHYHRPTITVNNDLINFIMMFDQTSLYLNDTCQNVINEFNELFMVYVNIYNKLRPEDEVKEIDKYIKVTYNIKTQQYDVLFAYHNTMFTKHEDRLKNNQWSKTLKAAMSRAPNLILFGEFSDTCEALLLKDTKNMILFPVTNNNLIYSTKENNLNHCFMVYDGLYKENELFNAIQSYLNLTDNDDCNILDPKLITRKTHLDSLLTLHNIMKF